MGVLGTGGALIFGDIWVISDHENRNLTLISLISIGEVASWIDRSRPGRLSGGDFEHQNAAFPARNGHRELSKMEWLWRPWGSGLCLTVDLAGLAIPYYDNWNLTLISQRGMATDSYQNGSRSGGHGAAVIGHSLICSDAVPYCENWNLTLISLSFLNYGFLIFFQNRPTSSAPIRAPV